MLQRALFRRRRCQRVVSFERASRHVFQALIKNAQALAKFFNFQHHAGVAVADATADRNFEVEVFITRVRASFTDIEIDTSSTQASTGGAPLQRFFLTISSNALRTAFQDGVAQRSFLVGIQTFRHPVEELFKQTFPTVWQVMCHTADTEPGRVHTETGNRFDQVIDFLTVGKGEEHRSHRAHILNKRGDVQQVAVDSEQFRQHDADNVYAFRNLDTRQFFDRQHVGHFVYAAAEVLDTVGIRNVAVPGLTLTHFLSATVVIADIRNAIDNFFTVELQDNTECTVSRWVVRTEVQEHEVFMFTAALHAPIFRLEGQRFHLEVFFLFGQFKRIELGGTRRVVFTQRMAFPRWRHHDARQVRVTIKGNAKHFPCFTLIPVRVREQFGYRWHVQVVFRQRHLEHDVAIAIDRNQVVENGKIRGR
ncbi:hypothetical protein D3C75_738780 [compost metagenome]